MDQNDFRIFQQCISGPAPIVEMMTTAGCHCSLSTGTQYGCRMQDEIWGPEEFVSEPITPAAGTGDIAAMARGEPGLPSRFTWRGQEYAVTAIVKRWKSSTREGGTGSLYLRKHWYLVETEAGSRMTLYCDRQTRNRRNPKARWWIYSTQNHVGR